MHRKYYVTYIITILIKTSLNKITSKTPKCEIETIEISQQYFSDRNCLTLIDIPQSKHPIDTLYKSLQKPKKTLKITDFNPGTKPKIRPRRDNFTSDGIIRIFCQDTYEGFLITSPNLTIFKTYSIESKISPLLSSQSKFLVILQDDPELQDYNNFFTESWKLFKAPNLVFINKNCQVIFHDKFIPNPDGSWGTTLIHNSQDIINNITLIHNDLTNLNKYPFRTILFFSLMAYQFYENSTYVEYGGMDGELIKILERCMGFTKIILPKIPKANYGEKTANGTFDGALKYLLDGDIEFISISYFLKDYLTRDIEFSSTGMQDDLCCVVHKSGKIPIWEIFYVYYEVWLMLCCSFFVIGSVWTLIQKSEAYFNDKDDYSDFIFLDTLRLMIVNSFPRIPQLMSERIFLVFTMMAFVTFLGAFQGSLMTILSKPSYYPDVKTLEQLAGKGYPILTRFEAIKNDMFGDDPTNPITVKLRKMVKLNKDKPSAEVLIARDGNLAGILRRSSAEIENKTRYYDEVGNDIIHLVEECPRAYALAYILPRKSAFAPRINDIILRTSQAGLFFKWYKEQAWNTTLLTRQSRLEQIEAAAGTKLKKFTINDLIVGFYILFVGYIISVIVFLVELIIRNCVYKI